MNQLLREFLTDADELMEALFADLQLLREQHTNARSRRESVARIFRHVHTLKGTAATAGLNTVSVIAHEFENALEGVRRGSLLLDESALDAFDDAAHALAEALDASASGATSTTPPQELLEQLRQLARGDNVQTAATQSIATTQGALPAEIARTLNAEEARRLHELIAEGQCLLVVHAVFSLPDFNQSFRALSETLRQRGELISTLPGATAEAAPGTIGLRLLCAVEARSVEEVTESVADFSSVTVEELPLEPQPAKAAALHAASDAAKNDVSETSAAPPTQVRVELSNLDELIASAHRLMNETLTALDLARSTAGDDRERIEACAERIQQHFVTLEEHLIGLRRVPLGRTLERAARAGRQAARALGKEVAFETTGVDVRLDKTLAEAVADSLLHLVRNAVGHGIETSAERAAAGKPARGLVRLAAHAEGDSVRIEITDDGRGIDLKSVSRAAVERGLLASGRSVSRNQALRLIFRPGFSTARTVSEVEGRGVGLDVVESAIERIGGEIHVSSETGRGTTFELIVPVALALLPALVVSSDGNSYCLDARTIAETLHVRAIDVTHVDGAESFDWRGVPLPLLRLRRLLGQSGVAAESAGSWPVLVVSTRAAKEANAGPHAHVGLLVDAWHEERAQVLVRRLGTHGRQWLGVSGATQLSDGTLALVLDLPRLLEAHAAAR